MARPKAAVPSMRFHLSGQAVVSIAGRDFYLGKHNSPEALARYAVLIADYQRGEFSLPAGYSIADVNAKAGALVSPLPPVKQADSPILVRHLTASYRIHITTIYASNPVEIERLNRLCDELDKNFGRLESVDFGPKALQEQRQKWVKSGKARVYCNRLTNAVRRIFKFGVSQELFDSTVWDRLKSVEPLRIGQTTAHETEPVQPANIEHVRATVKHLPPTLRAAIRVQVATGARPSEILRMRAIEIDRTGAEWMYRPKLHKNAKRGKLRAIPLVGDAKEAIIDFMNRSPESFLFSPKDAMAWWQAKKRSERKSKVPNSQLSRAKDNPEIEPGDCYDVHSYRRAIERAAKKAGVPAWHPYQLRHLAGTQIRDVLGPEEVQALLGHSNIRMTEHYARVSERKAIEAAKSAPTL
jgi:integrase